MVAFTLAAALVAVLQGARPLVAAGVPSVVGLVGLASYARYLSVSWKVHTAEEGLEGSDSGSFDYDTIIIEAATLVAKLHASQVATFYQAIVEPQSMYIRITESVQPLVRSLAVRTAYSFSHLDSLAQRNVVVPLMLQTRGALLDDLAVFDSDGHRVSTMGRTATLVFQLACLRFIVEQMGSEATASYAASVEVDVARFLSSFQPADLGRLNHLADSIFVLPCDTGREEYRRSINRLLRRLRRYYPIMVQSCWPANVGALCPPQRFTVERRTTAHLLADGGTGVSRYLNNIRDDVRRIMGIRPAIIAMPLVNADRSASYHIQMRGPEGSYLARQRIATFPSGLSPDLSQSEVEWRDRLGQRMSHLYVRNGQGYSSRYYVCHFFERMPGTLGNSTMSGLAAAVLILIAGWTRLAHVTAGPTDIVAVLLAFPAVAGAWLGLSQSTQLYGGVLMARISLVVTIAVSLIASTYYVVGPVPGKMTASGPFLARPGAVGWVLLVSCAAMNVFACIGGWLLRAEVESHFVKQRTQEMDDLGFDND